MTHEQAASVIVNDKFQVWVGDNNFLPGKVMRSYLGAYGEYRFDILMDDGREFKHVHRANLVWGPPWRYQKQDWSPRHGGLTIAPRWVAR